MWSYYGSKSKLAKYYPKPEHSLIIEPFAGSARYSLYGDNWKNEVILIDKYQVIIDLWNYLIQAKPEDILSLPEIEQGKTIDDYRQLTDSEKYLIGFCINRGSAVPKKSPKKFNSWGRNKEQIAENLFKIKHWKAICCDYTEIDNYYATWFIDPPYQFGGEWYRLSNKNMDYEKLKQWCLQRNGQIIICENTKADWMDFKPLVSFVGQLHETTEAIWYKYNNVVEENIPIDLSGINEYVLINDN